MFEKMLPIAVDERNPTPVDIVNIPVFMTGFIHPTGGLSSRDFSHPLHLEEMFAGQNLSGPHPVGNKLPQQKEALGCVWMCCKMS